VQSAVVATLSSAHRAVGTWSKRVDIYLAVSEFQRGLLLIGGLPPERVLVRPNFVHPDPGARAGGPGEWAVFVGRLSPEKGIEVLVEAFANLPDIPLVVVGDGPLRGWLEAEVARRNLTNVRVHGRADRAEVVEMLHRSRFLVFTSIWYEGLPLVLTEALACGVPAVASALGGMTEIIDDGVNGLHVRPGDPAHLAERARWAWQHEDDMAAMGRAGREKFEQRYAGGPGYQQLLDAYEQAAAHSARR
jgi:glycosyltransferase involved in cell wall biosynthesis